MLSVVIGFVRISQTSDEFLFWALLVNIFWSAFYFFMMFGVVWSAMRRKEVRLMYRFPARLDAPITLRYNRPDRTAVATSDFARNLNRTGVSVTLDEAIIPGTKVEMELVLPKTTVRALERSFVIRISRYQKEKREFQAEYDSLKSRFGIKTKYQSFCLEKSLRGNRPHCA